MPVFSHTVHARSGDCLFRVRRDHPFRSISRRQREKRAEKAFLNAFNPFFFLRGKPPSFAHAVSVAFQRGSTFSTPNVFEHLFISSGIQIFIHESALHNTVFIIVRFGISFAYE